ncbi:MAG TPA: 50S ribosomal protein L25 [Longimicrobiales bacterium]|nr:50S ribosomal protein L25 [Longimicrobiales bacterium]
MGTDAKLNAQQRQERGKSAMRKMRAEGRVPAVVYGHGDETRAISLDAHETALLFKRVHVENTIIELSIEGEKAPVKTLVREVQAHAHKPFLFHVDFQQVHAGERIHVDIPIRLLGTAAGTRVGGVLMHTVTDLPVKVLPDRIPETIDVDISGLEIGDSVHLRDIALPEGVEAEIDMDRTICSITPPTVAAPAAGEAADEAEEPEAGEPEVIGREGEDAGQ